MRMFLVLTLLVFVINLDACQSQNGHFMASYTGGGFLVYRDDRPFTWDSIDLVHFETWDNMIFRYTGPSGTKFQIQFNIPVILHQSHSQSTIGGSENAPQFAIYLIHNNNP